MLKLSLHIFNTVSAYTESTRHGLEFSAMLKQGEYWDGHEQSSEGTEVTKCTAKRKGNARDVIKIKELKGFRSRVYLRAGTHMHHQNSQLLLSSPKHSNSPQPHLRTIRYLIPLLRHITAKLLLDSHCHTKARAPQQNLILSTTLRSIPHRRSSSNAVKLASDICKQSLASVGVVVRGLHGVVMVVSTVN